MLARYVQKGESIDYRPTEAVSAGDVIVVSDLIGVARLDIPANKLGSLALVGVFDMVKSSAAVPSGSAVYWNAAAKQATPVSGSNRYLGKAIAGAAAGDASVRVLLNAPYQTEPEAPFTAGDAIPDLTDNSGGTAANTIPVITDANSQTAVASLAAKTNAILSALRSAGIIAGAE